MARILNLLEKVHTVDWLPDVFGRGAKDLDWIPKAAALNPRPVIVSNDGRILKNKVERLALKESGLTFVHLAAGWAGLAWPDRVWKLTRAWPGIVREAELLRRPAVLKVGVQNGKVTRTAYLSEL